MVVSPCCSLAPGYEPLGEIPYQCTALPLSLEGIASLGPPAPVSIQDSYLVDSASSHMLVSKIKPCMSKYKQSIP